MRRYLIGILFLSIGYSSNLFAAACCTSAAAFGVGRLLIWENFATGLSFSVAQDLGTFDDSGAYETLASESIQSELTWNLWGIAALTPTLSTFVQLPWAWKYLRYEDYAEGHLRLNDLQLGLRYQAIGIGEYAQLPGISFTGSVGFPTATGASQFDDSRRATWAFSAGLSLEKTWHPFFVQLNSGVSLPLWKQTGADFVIWRGPLVINSVASGVELFDQLVISLVPQFTWEYYNKAYDTSLALAASWRMSSHFTIQAGITGTLPISSLSQGGTATLSNYLGLRYGYF